VCCGIPAALAGLNCIQQQKWRNHSCVGLSFAQGSETPQERLKRLMAAQINKQQARDTVSVRQRQQVEARDAAARRQIERAAMSVDTRYSRSPSPRHALQPADGYPTRRLCRSLLQGE
jgi:hypothetical protein